MSHNLSKGPLLAKVAVVKRQKITDYLVEQNINYFVLIVSTETITSNGQFIEYVNIYRALSCMHSENLKL